MNNYLKLDITLQISYDRWHVYFRDVLTPLIEELQTEKKLLQFNLKLKIYVQPLITVSLLVNTLSANDLTNRIQTMFEKHCDISKNYKNDDLSISVNQLVDTDDIMSWKKSDILISQAISYAILGGLLQDELDGDLIFTFGIYLLFAAHSCCSAASAPFVAKTVYEFFMSQSIVSTLATDRIFHSVKYHTVSSAINEAYEEIFQSNTKDQQWLQNFVDDIGVLLGKFNNEATTVAPFITLIESLRAQLNLNEKSINMLNYFVWQTLSKPEFNTSPTPEESLLLVSENTKTQRATRNKIPLLTYYSPSHTSMFNDFFLPSYQKYLKDDFELFVLNGDQLCAGFFEEDSWNEQVKEKIIFVNEFIQNTDSQYVVFSDVDIIFFKNIYNELLEELNGFDMTFQNDSLNGLTDNLCSGFYCCRVNKRTRRFFEKMVNEYQNSLSDQQNLNLLLPMAEGLTYNELSNRFYNFSHADGKIWFNNKAIAFPKRPILMYHANYTVGTVHKEFLLEVFRDWDNMFF